MNRYTAEVLASSGAATGGKAVSGKRRVKGSRFAKDDADGGGSTPASSAANGSASGSGRGESGNDPFTRALEPPKPRAYVSGRIVVFVVGGITQLEIAAMDRLSHSSNREVIVGGTSLLTARDFLEQAYMTEPSTDDDDDEDGRGRGGGGGGGGKGGGDAGFTYDMEGF